MVSRAAPSLSNIRPIVVTLPKQVLELLALTPEDAPVYLKKLALIDLVRRGQVSSGWAAEALGVSKADFQKVLAEHEVPYLDLSEEELRRQVEVAMPDREHGEKPPSGMAVH